MSFYEDMLDIADEWAEQEGASAIEGHYTKRQKSYAKEIGSLV